MGHICTGPRWGLLGVVRAAVGADRIHRGNSRPKVARLLQNRSTGTLPLSACAHSPAPSAVRGATNAHPTEGYRCPLHSSQARGGASRLCRTGSRSRLCAVVRTRVRPSSGGTALNRNSSRLHAMLTSKVRRGGPYMQDAARLCPAKFDIQSTRETETTRGSNAEL